MQGEVTLTSLLPDFPLPQNSGEAESRDATPSGQSLQDLQAQKAAAEEEAAAMHEEMLTFKRQVADAEAKSRSDRKVRPINSACCCELDMLPQACCQETQYVPQQILRQPLVFHSAVQCCALMQLRWLRARLAEIRPNHSEKQLHLSRSAFKCCIVPNGPLLSKPLPAGYLPVSQD